MECPCWDEFWDCRAVPICETWKSLLLPTSTPSLSSDKVSDTITVSQTRKRRTVASATSKQSVTTTATNTPKTVTGARATGSKKRQTAKSRQSVPSSPPRLTATTTTMMATTTTTTATTTTTMTTTMMTTMMTTTTMQTTSRRRRRRPRIGTLTTTTAMTTSSPTSINGKNYTRNGRTVVDHASHETAWSHATDMTIKLSSTVSPIVMCIMIIYFCCRGWARHHANRRNRTNSYRPENQETAPPSYLNLPLAFPGDDQLVSPPITMTELFQHHTEAVQASVQPTSLPSTGQLPLSMTPPLYQSVRHTEMP